MVWKHKESVRGWGKFGFMPRCVGAHVSLLRFNYTTFAPFKAYGVEGWWLDNLLKAGKLSQRTYLSLAAQVTVGFQKRLADCRAAERFLQEGALRSAIAADAKALEGDMLPMRRFGQIEAMGARVALSFKFEVR